MTKLRQRAFSLILAGTLVIGSLPNYVSAQMKLSADTLNKKQAVGEMQEGNKTEYIEGNITYYKEIKYYTAQTGVVKNRLMYADMPSNGVGLIYTYDLEADQYKATSYKLSEDSSKTGFLATTIGDVFYGMYSVEDIFGRFNASLVSVPVESGMVQISCSTKGGTVKGIGSYLPGDTVTLQAVPDNGYFLKSFQVDSTIPSTSQVILVMQR